jgi:D-3-phosphoglycerate dehydrogenase / 2-oxoglutarate reductase
MTRRILVLGDPFCPSAVLRVAFADLEAETEVTFADVIEEPDWVAVSGSDRRIREYIGSPRQVIDALDGHDVLVVQAAPVTEAVLDAWPSVRLVCCVRGGPVNVDVAAATARGIPVVITPGKNADAVAELTIAFLIMLARRLPEMLRYIDAGGVFGHDNHEGAHWFGHDVAGKTLGLVGYGQVGRRVALRALALGMRVVAFDPFMGAATLVADGVEAADLDTLLGVSDFVSLHARATAENEGLIGSDAVARMKPGAFLINTARVSLVDEAAVLDGLRSGHLAGLAVDVVSPSPASGRHPVLAFPNVIVTAHIGGATEETLLHGGEMAAAEIGRFLRGEPLRNVADRSALG